MNFHFKLHSAFTIFFFWTYCRFCSDTALDFRFRTDKPAGESTIGTMKSSQYRRFFKAPMFVALVSGWILSIPSFSEQSKPSTRAAKFWSAEEFRPLRASTEHGIPTFTFKFATKSPFPCLKIFLFKRSRNFARREVVRQLRRFYTVILIFWCYVAYIFDAVMLIFYTFSNQTVLWYQFRVKQVCCTGIADRSVLWMYALTTVKSWAKNVTKYSY